MNSQNKGVNSRYTNLPNTKGEPNDNRKNNMKPQQAYSNTKRPSANKITKKSDQYRWNVVSESKFRKRVGIIFNIVSKSLTNTLGPYGATTIIEKFGEAHITKDGWQVLKNLRFDNSMDNNILAMLQRISAQVVIKVGDGSTSSIVATNAIMNELARESGVLSALRPKEFMDLLVQCVDEIASHIYTDAKLVNKTTFEEIYKLAYISTNGNEEISKMIQDIYKQTSNPAIEYKQSKSDKTYFEIVDGYKIERATVIDAIFTNNDDGTTVVNSPMIMMFDHTVDMADGYDLIGKAVQIAIENKTRLVVIAPGYDKEVRREISKYIPNELRDKGTTNVVYCYANRINALDQLMYNDFAMLSGTSVIQEDFYDKYRETETEAWVSEQLGEVESMVINSDSITIKGFKKKNENVYNAVLMNARAEYTKMEEDYRSKSLIDFKLNDARNRLRKLEGVMGVIHVGGYTSLEKTANYDLVDDAVKACESAYINGYNIGGNLIIPYTIRKIIREYETANVIIPKEKVAVFTILSTAFKTVFKTVIKNKYKGFGFDGKPLEIPSNVTEDYLERIIEDCMRGELRCYDLVNETYSSDIINSCITDIEILKASVSIISLITSSNQYISTDFSK